MVFLGTGLLRGTLLACLAAALLPGGVAAAEPSATKKTQAAELQVKAAFLLNFAAFVTWPEHAFESPTAPIVVGIYGRDPFGTAIDEIFRGEAIRGHPFELRRIERGGNLDECHIVFVANSERRNYEQVNTRLRDRPALTVADGPGFNQAGGMIEFVQERGRIRFRINDRAASAAGLVLSSKLLRLAQGSAPK